MFYKSMQNQSNKTQKSSLQKLKEESQNKNDIAKFIRSYELKQTAVKELVVLYSKHFFSDHFALTFKAAVALLVIPSLTNIYYALRPNSIFSGIIPYAMPLICLTNYIYFFNKDMQQFSLTNEPDAQLVRNQYEIITEFSYFNRDNQSYLSKLQNFRQDNRKNKADEKI